MNRFHSYTVELNGTLMNGCGNRLQPVDSLRRVKGDYCLFTDLQGAVSRTMAVEADARYAELMISRKLQETGEFDEPVFLITHWKKKRSKNLTDICFTALPSKRYFQYLDQVEQHNAHLVIMPLQSVLWEVLRKYAKRNPAAVVFQQDRFADIIVGTRKKVWYAGRTVAYDTSQEQIDALWETVRADIQSACGEYSQSVETVYVVTWMDSGALPNWTDAEFSLNLLDQQEIYCGDQSFRSSLPGLIRTGKAQPILASSKEKVFFSARRLLPYMNLLLCAIAALCAAAGAWYQHQGNELEERLEAMKERASEIRTRIPDNVDQVAYGPTLEFVDQVWSSRRLPTYGQVLRDFAIGPDTAMQVEQLKADYSASKVEVNVFGSVNEGFEDAHMAYYRLLSQLRARGYRVIEERFDTRIRNSHFSLHLVKEVQ